MRKALSIAAALIALFLIGSRAWGQIETSPAPAARKPILAVLPLEAEGISEQMAAQVTSVLRDELAALGCFELVARDRIDAALKGHSGLFSGNWAIVIGRDVSADKVVFGSLGLKDGAYQFDIRLLTVTTQATEATPTVSCLAPELPKCLGQVASDLSSCTRSRASNEPLEKTLENQALDRSKAKRDQGSLNLAALRARLSWSQKKTLNECLSQKRMGEILLFPGMFWSILCGGVALAKTFSDTESELALYALSIGLPGFILTATGAGLVIDAEGRIRKLARESGRASFGFQLDPRQRLYGFSISYTF